MDYERIDSEAECRLRIAGSLDASTVSALRPMTDALAQERTRKVVVDLAALAMIDSSGIGLLVGLSKRLPAGALKLVNVDGQPLLVIKVLKLEGLFGLSS